VRCAPTHGGDRVPDILQRGSRHPVIETGDQLYETPACATRALIKHEHLPYRLWEPCAGRGAIARVLRARGFKVIASDLVRYEDQDGYVAPGIDFLTITAAPAHTTCIVTNPPYKHADAIIRHGLKLCAKVVVLLRLAAMEGAARSDLIDGHLARVWVGIERLPMMHRDGWAGNRLRDNAAPFAWFVFEQRHKGHHKSFSCQRISWREQ